MLQKRLTLTCVHISPLCGDKFFILSAECYVCSHFIGHSIIVCEFDILCLQSDLVCVAVFFRSAHKMVSIGLMVLQKGSPDIN